MGKKKALGRGLDALLGSSLETTAGNPQAPGEDLKRIPLDRIQRGRYQPRIEIKEDALAQLAASIKAQGVVQPIVVRPIAGRDRYELVAGERRWRASQRAGLDSIPALVKAIPDHAALSVALIENIQREQLNPLEEAVALRRLAEEFAMSHQAVAEAIGRSRAAVSNLLRLLELDTEVKKLLEHGEIDMGHARALVGLDAVSQRDIAAQVVARGLSVRQTENLARQARSGRKTSSSRRGTTDPDVRRLQDSLSDRLGAPVSIRHSSSGHGSLTIKYASLDELDGILDHIK